MQKRNMSTNSAHFLFFVFSVNDSKALFTGRAKQLSASGRSY